MNKPFTIGITGGSGSGKSYFLQGLSSCFKPHQICLISQDNYYKSRDQQPIDENGVKNFDLPVSRKEIGELIGMTTENVIRIFSEFRRDEISQIFSENRQATRSSASFVP